jgi:hypothetical protein
MGLNQINNAPKFHGGERGFLMLNQIRLNEHIHTLTMVMIGKLFYQRPLKKI